MCADFKKKDEHNKERNERYKKEPNGNSRVENIYPEFLNFTGLA